MSQSDSELLQRYVAERAEPAFAELVRRHIDLVFSAALRLAEGNRSLAEDVTQDVFTDLARKAARLTTHTSLVGWLYTSTRYSARDARRSDHRRLVREQQAFAMNQLLQPEPSLDWEQLRPLLDDAMHALNESDRQAVLLRFFNRLPLAEVGARLAVSENTARMRVDRALDKLRTHLEKRGFTSTAAILATMLSSQAVQSAPMGLAATVTSAAVATGAAAAVGGWAAMAGLKGFLAVAVVVAILLAAPAVRHYARARRSGPLAAQASPVGNAPAASPGDTPAAGQPIGPVLTLHLLNGKNDKPLAGVQIDSSAWSKGVLDHRALSADDEGIARVLYPADTTNLVLITEKDGYADTKLTWQPDHGELIPQSYTLRPDPAVPISGTVVDEQGQPVAAATVEWSILRSYDAPGRLSPESHTLTNISVRTDANGRWRMTRAADDLIHLLTATVDHPQYGTTMALVGPAPSLPGQRDSERDQQLRQGTAIFTLRSQTGTIHGIVIDVNGTPVPGAKVRVGGLLLSNHNQTITRTDGSFTMDGLASEFGSGFIRPLVEGVAGQSLNHLQLPVTAEADGFAPAATLLNPASNSTPVHLTMQPAQPLRLRVAGPDGSPIAGAEVRYDWMSLQSPANMQDYPDLALAQVKFSEKTGDDGRLIWTNAPSGTVMFGVNAPGFETIRDVPARSDGEEHLITLRPGTLVTGTVRDDSTGAAIPRFRVVQGYPIIRPFLQRTNFNWMGNTAAEFSDGAFSQDLNARPLLMRKGCMLKFEAVDYEPFVSRIFQAGEGAIHLDVVLHPSKWLIITVLKPNGQPAGGADVGLVSPGARLRLGQGHFVHNPLDTGLSQTEMDGRFRLKSDPSVTRIIIASDDGYLSATPECLKTNSTVRLEPWGSIEATCVADGKPVAGVSFKLGLEDESDDSVMCAMSREDYVFSSDAQGHFTIQRAPPGKDELLRITTGLGPNGNGYHLPGVTFSVGDDGKRIEEKEQEGRTPVIVLPGQTTTVTVQP